MKETYIPQEIEKEVQKIWENNNEFSTVKDENKEKYYCLAMIPYPSGRLHMGHVRNYTISDVIARYQRMIGKNVLHPIGWDAFGLPAEIAAIQNNVNPYEWTRSNIQYMKQQLKSLGFSYDWNREITTCKSEYYKWEQWFFIELYNKKLIYKKKSWVNWCKTDKTVLANEQVVNGLCWRCNTKITKKNISQWFIKITNYAEELLNGLKDLSQWPEKVKKMQSNWIGKLSGIVINVKVDTMTETISIFTSQPEIIMGTTYIAISPSHKLSKKISRTNNDIHNFIKKKRNFKPCNSYLKKNSGIYTEKFALHPLTKKKVPIWIANYVSLEYGTEAILGIPAHNQNDLDFALTHKLKITPVILTEDGNIPNITNIAIKKSGKLCNSGKYNYLHTKKAHDSIISKLEKNKEGKKEIRYRLKDWGVSRQRYWGVPIPMATLKNNNTIPIPKKYLPIKLSKHKNNMHSYQEFLHSLKKRTIKINGQLATCESDTLDTFVESSWYYARYTCTQFNLGMIEKKSADYWLPVDLYVGGIEHSTMHLLYFRFFHKLLRDFGLVTSNEPVKKLLCQGMVLSDAFYYFDNNNCQRWINISPNDYKYDLEGKIKKSFIYQKQTIFHAGMIKMSKSKKNGIDPKKMINQYGADTIRLFIMFSAPVETSLEWKESGVKGMYRFLKKLWTFCYNYIQKYKTLNTQVNYHNLTNNQKELYLLLCKVIKEVEHDISQKQSFNTAISNIMKLTKKLFEISVHKNNNKELIRKTLLSILKMLYPFVPHFSYTLLNILLKQDKNKNNIKWPKISENFTHNDTSLILIQINGKLRHKILVNKKYNKQNILKKILKEQKIFKYTKNMIIKKIIYIPNKLINLVIDY
ncbi:MAG: leucine--tRNA ligase [Buchnera aphidicola (Schlechtendalia peitan)]